MAKSKAGRKPIKITKAMCKKAESLAAQGLTLRQISYTLGMSFQTLNETRKEYVEFSDSIKAGKAKGIATVTNSLFNKAKDGDVQAIKYYLNNRDNANWRDKQEIEHSGEVVTFNMDYSGKPKNAND